MNLKSWTKSIYEYWSQWIKIRTKKQKEEQSVNKYYRFFIKYLIRTTWIFYILLMLCVPLLFIMVKKDVFDLFGGLPSLQELERPDPDLSSELISVDGVSLGKYFRKNRTPVTYNDLSPELINTLLVTEDVRFNSHSGIDLRGLMRAILGKLTFTFKGGGSTIPMQLAENLYRTNNIQQGSLYQSNKLFRQLITKVKEWIIAVQLEQNYTKEEILAMYLNTVEFGSNSYGIKVAAKTFFDKLPSQLNYPEAAILVGLINAPTRWSPVFNPKNALKKRTEVLWNLYKYETIPKTTFDSLDTLPISLNYKVTNQNEGIATYFRTVVRNFLLQWSDSNGYDIFEDGLKIHTTIHSKMQVYAEEAVREHMRRMQRIFDRHWKGRNPWIDENNREIPFYLQDAIKRTPAYKSLYAKFNNQKDSIEFYLNQKKQMKVFSWKEEIDTFFSSYDSLRYYKKFLQAGFMAMDPQTGHIKAWVGGINHQYFKFDHVKQGRRQPGSVFKPIVYTAAVDNGYSPCFPVVDAPVSFSLPNQDPPTWVPQNSTGRFSGEIMTLRQAMARSVNSITAFMMNRIGPETVVDYAKRLGIESPLEAVPSLCLGAGGDVSVYEMVGAYSTLVNRGTYIKPFFISHIEDKDGNIIQQFIPKEKEAINEETAYIMLHMLKGTLVERGGTALGLDYDLRARNDIGAKTGTTQNASDGWFIGITKNLAAGAWVGSDDRSIHFRDWYLGQGARTAMPIWEKFMKKVYANEKLGIDKGRFSRPSVSINTILNCDIYGRRQENYGNEQYDVVDESDF